MQNETPNQQWENKPIEELKPVNAPENSLSDSEGWKTASETSGERPAEESTVPQLKKESGFKRFLRFLFGPDTRVGKFMRPFLRGLAMIVIAFVIGLLVAYFVLYQPTRAQLSEALGVMQQMNTTLQEYQTTITTLEGEVAGQQATMAAQQAENELSNYRIYFLIVKNDVMRAQLALADEKNAPGGSSAMAVLDDLEKHLTDLLPYVQADDPVLADLLTNRLDVVKNELIRDSEQARVELDHFYTNLLELETTLFE